MFAWTLSYQQVADDLRHYNDVIMSTMASWITSRTIVYSTIYSGTDQREHQSCASLASTQRASNVENVSIWWFHHDAMMLMWRHCNTHTHMNLAYISLWHNSLCEWCSKVSHGISKSWSCCYLILITMLIYSAPKWRGCSLTWCMLWLICTMPQLTQGRDGIYRKISNISCTFVGN